MGGEKMATRDFGAESTTDDVLSGMNLEGKRALVTGASGGLGAETARALASAGAEVILTARDLDKANKVLESIRTSTGKNRLTILELSLHSQKSVRACAHAFYERFDSLDILINNAGVMACPLRRTEEGYEYQFATNHLGHFLLTGLLAPALEKGAPSRVVTVSSGGHRFSPVHFDDIQFDRRAYDKFLAYGQAKTANILFSVELDRRLQEEGVRANALHPGVILTELSRYMTQEDLESLIESAPPGGFSFKPVECGAATSTWAATAPELAEVGGRYLEDCKISGPIRADRPLLGHESWATDPKAAKRLWTVSEELVGERFAF